MSAQASGLNMAAGSDQQDVEELINAGAANPFDEGAETNPTIRALMNLMQSMMKQHAEQIQKMEEKLQEALAGTAKTKEDEDFPCHRSRYRRFRRRPVHPCHRH